MDHASRRDSIARTQGPPSQRTYICHDDSAAASARVCLLSRLLAWCCLLLARTTTRRQGRFGRRSPTARCPISRCSAAPVTVVGSVGREESIDERPRPMQLIRSTDGWVGFRSSSRSMQRRIAATRIIRVLQGRRRRLPFDRAETQAASGSTAWASTCSSPSPARPPAAGTPTSARRAAPPRARRSSTRW